MRFLASTNPTDVDFQEDGTNQRIFETLSLQILAKGLLPYGYKFYAWNVSLREKQRPNRRVILERQGKGKGLAEVVHCAYPRYGTLVSEF